MHFILIFKFLLYFNHLIIKVDRDQFFYKKYKNYNINYKYFKLIKIIFIYNSFNLTIVLQRYLINRKNSIIAKVLTYASLLK